MSNKASRFLNKAATRRHNCTRFTQPSHRQVEKRSKQPIQGVVCTSTLGNPLASGEEHHGKSGGQQRTWKRESRRFYIARRVLGGGGDLPTEGVP
ncbi:hypothetical protein TNCT_137831 [Trichonephila clavata]|uniref:Uncharacterized protein n=1 Tax=Trichonephila clavata TaxID=2740835 RepID=A0A8X6KMD3_TRICU|nr:hypothetical protein TNCT_137831 [Trichonephila clavata]